MKQQTKKIGRITLAVITILVLMTTNIRFITPLLNFVTTLNTGTHLAEASTVTVSGKIDFTIDVGGRCIGTDDYGNGHSWHASGIGDSKSCGAANNNDGNYYRWETGQLLNQSIGFNMANNRVTFSDNSIFAVFKGHTDRYNNPVAPQIRNYCQFQYHDRSWSASTSTFLVGIANSYYADDARGMTLCKKTQTTDFTPSDFGGKIPVKGQITQTGNMMWVTALTDPDFFKDAPDFLPVTVLYVGGGFMSANMTVTGIQQPFVLNCPSGTTKIGSGESAYCEKAVYPTSCPSGQTLIGSGAGAYCKQTVINNVKQTEYTNPNFLKDIDLSKLIGNMGDYGSTGDNKLDISGTDSGTHNNGWHLNGTGEAYKSNHVQFTNVPDNGYINAIGNAWSPNFLITQGKIKLDVPIKEGSTTAEKQKWDKSLADYKATGSTTEVIAYEVTDLEALKSIQESQKGLIDLFTKNASNYVHNSNIVSASVTSGGMNDMNNLKLTKGGYYILATKYIDVVSTKKEQATPSQATLDKHTYYSFIPVNVNFMTDLGYLPIYNNLLAQVSETMLVTGNKKANHKLTNLSYSTYKSMKVPSAYSSESGKTLIGSTTGGLQLTDSKMNPVAITGETTLSSSAKVTDIVEHLNGFYLSTDKGVLYLNCEDNSLNKTTITEPINDLMLSHNTLYILTDETLSIAFVGGDELIVSSKEYNLKELFYDVNAKGGRIEEVNGLLNISSKDDGSVSEVIMLAK